MTELLFASQNKNKSKELTEILGQDYKILSLADLNYNEDIDETGLTFEENALIKARHIYNMYHKPCIADDSGLEVEVLNGEPGVYSARYSGADNNSLANMSKLLQKLDGEINRNAQFRTVIAFVSSQGEFLFEGIVKGVITTEMKGSEGFGYDPIFQPTFGNGLTFAQMSPAEKNNISHRAMAVKKFVTFLKNNR